MTRISTLLKALALSAVLALNTAHAATASGTILDTSATWNADSTAGNDEIFYFTGSSVTNTLSTNLGSVTHLDVSVPYFKVLSEDLTFTFSLNGTDIGSWTLAAGYSYLSMDIQSLSFDFSSISSGTGVYELAMRVSSGVSAGGGGLLLDVTEPGSYTLTGTVLSVPEADTWAMLLAGLAFIGFIAYQRKARLSLARLTH